MPTLSERVIPSGPTAPAAASAPLRLLWQAVIAYVALIALGAALLQVPGMLIRGNELSPAAAVFMATNAATLTGFDPATTLQQYRPPGLAVLLMMMIAGSLLSLGAGGVAVARLANLPFSTGRIIRSGLVFYLAAVTIGTIGLASGRESVLAAAFLACSAIGNVGLALGPLPAVDHWQTHGVLMPLAVLGGLGIPVVLDLWDRLLGRRRQLSGYTLAVLVLTAAIYIAGLGLMWLSMSPLEASATSLNTRSTGFGFVHADRLPRYAQWMLMLFMLIGGSAAGTAGGLRLETLALLGRGTRQALRGGPVRRIFAVALLWTALYLTLLITAQLTMLHTEPQVPADRMLFDVISAAGNVGLSFGSVSLVGPGLYALCLTMLAGRTLPLLMLALAGRIELSRRQRETTDQP